MTVKREATVFTIILPAHKRLEMDEACRINTWGLMCTMPEHHKGDWHAAYGTDGVVPLMVWLTEEADRKRRQGKDI